MNKSTMIYIAIFFAGVMLADKVRALPIVNKLPSI
jgi:hypothetical protein